MEPWEAYLPNSLTEEYQQMKYEYQGWFLEDKQEITPLGLEAIYDFAIREIENHLFLVGGESEEDIRLEDGEDLNYALGRPALIFQLGMERDAEPVAILKCILYWAGENCKGVKYGVNPFLREVFRDAEFEKMMNERSTKELLPSKPEDYEYLAKILYGGAE